ncbi:hypothetical protein ABIE78_001679 [Sinorhizobium fredii]|uniref:Hemerythrin-like domain-containing protein n=1 Tax=Sinorhizobium fredii (strain USDA 257) TaxID=1185652 RepID=I3X985_SINF2|nr:hemerythrin domain-containing protein [Sinorhizobium fredii]AFL52441.1 hypothetical protein USDA257_c38960 [Sinorhizobium fredii USDA 257]
MIARIIGLAPPRERSPVPEELAARLARLARGHIDLLALCDSLEAIADSLPDQLDRKMCAYATETLGSILRHLHVTEEQVVFAWAEKCFGSDPSVPTMLDCLRHEHREDECFAEELADMLARLGAADDSVNPETAGYMLRGFFTNPAGMFASNRSACAA